jgi:hypothetical protein
MKIVLTLLVRDEEDILEDNLNFHLNQGVDFIIATDNRSRDGTRAVLESYASRRLLRIIDEPADDYSQGLWVSRMACLAAREHAADWVINSDADEFWWPRQGSISETLNAVPASIGGLAIRRYDFPPVPESPAPFHHRMQIREVSSRNALGEPLPPKVCHRAVDDAVVAQGNHAVRGTGLGPILADGSLLVFHFPIRTYAQFENKIRLGGAAYARNSQLGPDVGSTWRMLHSRLLQGTLRDYYDERVTGPAQLAAGIEAGSLVLDRRLHRYLCDAASRPASLDEPAVTFARPKA